VPARIAYLSDDEKSAIYEAALEIMATIGQRVHHPEALELLRAAGAEVEGDLVKVPRELVEKARRTAPPVVDVYSRTGEHAMALGRHNTYFGNGSAVTSVYDLETGEHRPTTLADGEMAARLCDALPQVDFVMAYAHPGDHDPHVALLESFRAMVKNTTKPLVVVAENAGDLTVMCDIAEALRGGSVELAAKPYFVVYGEPTSALRHPVEAVDKLILCADRSVPCVYSTSPLAGGTAPITVAGHVAQGAAESLMGLVIHQLRKPGAPFVFGIGPAVLDMGTMQSAYNAPEYLMGYVCAVELAKWLDLPNWGYAGTTDAQVIDAQAGMEAAELTFLSLTIGSNLNHDIGYLDYGMTGSLELTVLTDEFLAMNRKLVAGVEVTPETLAVDVVRDVGPGGDFLSHRQTAKQVRKAQWRPTIINRQGHVRWLEEGGLDLKEKARRKALKLLAEHEPAPLDAAVAARIDALVAGFVPGEATTGAEG
jgi:trimethylamine--corrinoid protein Co-methyltransferase